MPELKESQELSKLKSFLNELFQFESQDLDFGIYKILNYKRKEIKDFIDNLLTNEVKTQLNLLNEAEHKKLRGDLTELEKDQLIKRYINEKEEDKRKYLESISKDNIEKYKKLKEQVTNLTATSNAEPIIYNHLTIFFSRYYDKGDFISKRRFGKTEKYVVPYNGEETYFYWANNDQYYIKSSEFFRKYSFKLDKTKQIVNFRIKEAEEETGNVKSENNKYFVLAEDQVQISENEINIYFEYRAISEQEKTSKGKKQDELNQYAAEQIKKGLGKDKSVEELYKYVNEEKKLTKIFYELNRYTNRNTYDFFIHKDLKGFLSRELDFYIKNEMLNLDDLTVFDTETHLEKVRLSFNTLKTFKHIAGTIIDFVSQIEDFQKKLWEKKKFVINTEYVITLDKLASFTSATFTNEVIKEVLKNKNQVNEWKELFGEDLFSKWNDIKAVDLKDGMFGYKKLPIDTKYFTNDFKWKLICEISKKNFIDEILDGYLYNSDNFQMLNLLKEKFNGYINKIYIDPPYNTGNDEFIYKDNYMHSCWISFMADRLHLSSELLAQNGSISISINNKEYLSLQHLIQRFLPQRESDLIIKVRHEERILRGDIRYQDVIEYVVRGSKNDFVPSRISDDNGDDENVSVYKYGVKILVEKPFAIEKIGNYEVEIYKKDQYLIEETEPNKGSLKRYTIRGSLITQKGSASEFYELYLRNRKDEDGHACLYKVIGMGIKGDGIGYRYIMQPLKGEGKNGIYFQGFPLKNTQERGNPYPNFYDFTKEFNNTQDEGGVRFTNGKKPITFILKLLEISNLPDEGYVLDYFGGSGTTAEAVIKYNISFKKRNKFMIDEFNKVFYDYTLPRLKKIGYTLDWKDNKPENMNGLGIFFKYQRLEQYEEALENIAFTNGEDTEQIQMQYKDYIPKYFLNFETQNSNTFLNLEELKNPFNYTLKVFDNYQYKEQAVDVIETFNYLIGLYVSKYEILQHNSKNYCFVFGTKRDKKKVLIIWRDVTKIDYDEDKKFITSQLKNYEYDTLYINHQASIEGYEAIENVFKNKMG